VSGPTVAIEAAQQTDFDEVRKLQRAIPGSVLDENEFLEAVRSGNCAIARVNGRIEGFAIVATWFYGRRFLSLIAVRPECRRSRIATRLVEHVAASSPRGLFTSTNRSNVAAQRLFEGLGFVRSGIVENLDADDPELVYFKQPQ
jgi:ribosomal protein S18 acetylase RimI-like enzyme